VRYLAGRMRLAARALPGLMACAAGQLSQPAQAGRGGRQLSRFQAGGCEVPVRGPAAACAQLAGCLAHALCRGLPGRLAPGQGGRLAHTGPDGSCARLSRLVTPCAGRGLPGGQLLPASSRAGSPGRGPLVRRGSAWPRTAGHTAADLGALAGLLLSYCEPPRITAGQGVARSWAPGGLPGSELDICPSSFIIQGPEGL